MSVDSDLVRPAAHTHAPPVRRPSWWRQLNATPVSRSLAGILLGLVLLTGAAWAYLVHAGNGMDGHGAMSPTMGVGPMLFLAIWIAMTVATMFPTAAPMILMYGRVAGNRRTNGSTWAPTWLFVSGYLVLWTSLGVVAYGIAVGAEQIGEQLPWVQDNAVRLGGAVIVLAGAYQFSRVKDRCLTECRSPLMFLGTHWREGRRGAVVMGMHHGLHCAGCCVALMAVLVPIGMMNMAALAGITAFVYAEKVLPGWRVMRSVAGVALIAFGLLVTASPGILPGPQAVTGHHMGHP